MEAGIEHFGRGTDNYVDAVLMIVDPSFESLRLSEKIGELCRSIGKPNYFCLNKLTAENEPVMVDAVGKQGTIVCKIPLNAQLGNAGLTGAELTVSVPEIADMAANLSK